MDEVLPPYPISVASMAYAHRARAGVPAPDSSVFSPRDTAPPSREAPAPVPTLVSRARVVKKQRVVAAPLQGAFAPSAQKKNRNFCVTINNPPLDDAGAVVLPDPEIWPRHVYSIWQLERGESGTLHWQVYVEFSSQFTLAQLKKLPGLERAHIEPRRGSADQARAYCTPEKGGAVRDPTVEGEAPLEFGTRKQVVCINCWIHLLRKIYLLVLPVSDDENGFVDILNQVYFVPGEEADEDFVGWLPCPCTRRPLDGNDVFPPTLRVQWI